jgi:predicted deacylase
MPQLRTISPSEELQIVRGTRASLGVHVAVMGDGGELRVPVHILAGKATGPRLVVLSTAHGYEIDQISVLMELYRTIELDDVSGELVLIPVANPVAFEMGSRNSWVDGLWGDSGNMNRLWPGRPNGWLTERICYAIATVIGQGAQAVIDLHSRGPTRVLSYGYVGPGSPGELRHDITLVFGHSILVRQTPEELAEKRQTAGTSSAWLRSLGTASYSCEIGPFYGLDEDRPPDRPAPLLDVPEIGVRGVRNVMKLLGMLPGEPELPSHRVIVRPELNLRPDDGGLLVSEFDETAVGRRVPGGTLLGTVVSPFTFDATGTLVAPFDETLILGATCRRPYAKVNPGDIGYIVADWSTVEEVT